MKKFISTILYLCILAVVIVIGVYVVRFVQDLYGVNFMEEAEEFVTDLSQVNFEEDLTQKIETPSIITNKTSDTQTVSSEIENVDYTNVKVNKYFYNQLNDYSKIIYKAFESNKEKMKTGTYKVELGTSFSTLLAKENGQTLLGNYYQSAIEAYTYDNPDVFYLNPNKMYINIETITKRKSVTYNVYIDSGNEASYLTDEFSTKAQVDAAMAKIEGVREAVINSKQANVYDNVKLIHNYLIKQISYDETVSKPNIYNIYGALINKECVCEGYAKSFKYLMDALGIPCTIIIGKGTNSQGQSESHAWNYVQINGNWYAVDVTWDDPIVVGNGNLDSKRKYKFFLVGSQEFSSSHTPSGKFTENGMEFSYPTLSAVSFR